jgi:hypothetical protein
MLKAKGIKLDKGGSIGENVYVPKEMPKKKRSSKRRSLNCRSSLMICGHN